VGTFSRLLKPPSRWSSALHGAEYHSNAPRERVMTSTLEPKYVTPEQAVQVIESGNRVFLHTGAATPRCLVECMTKRHDELNDVKVVHLSTDHEAPYINYPSSFTDTAFFVSANVRRSVQEGRSEYIPIFLSEISQLFKTQRGDTEPVLPLDVAMLSVSVPDKHGFVTLGPSVDVSLSAARRAKITVGSVNKHMPRTHGAGQLHVSHFQYLSEHDEPLPEMHTSEGDSDAFTAIGVHVAALINDSSCLQMGIGRIPNAVLGQLMGHRDLGVHTEMFSDGLIDLVEAGMCVCLCVCVCVYVYTYMCVWVGMGDPPDLPRYVCVCVWMHISS
jgi:4-hydroxybutyrate CoA-transferase